MKFETSVDYIDNALCVVNKRMTKKGSIKYNTDINILESIKLQLIYIKNILTAKEIDRSRLKDIIIGYYAAKELDGNDPVLQNCLFGASYISDQISSGLKIELPHQASDNYFDRIKKLINQFPDDFN